MNYAQLYVYLDSRPHEEIQGCMHRVAEIVRKHTPEKEQSALHSALVSNSNYPSLKSSAEIQSKLHQLQTAQKVWTQEAVWNKFGSSADHHRSVQDLALATSQLFTIKEVAQYVLDITTKIDAEDDKAQGNTSTFSGKSMESATKVDPFPLKKRKLEFNERAEQASNVISLVETSSSSHNSITKVKSTTGGASLQTMTSLHEVKRHKPATKVSPWTKEDDEALGRAVAAYRDEGWDVVAEHVGRKFTKQQCCSRYKSFVRPIKEGLRKGADWTEPDLTRLELLVAKHTIEPTWSEGLKAMTQQRIDWQAIGKVLNRVPTDCCHKWTTVTKARITNAPFTAQDDALILRREMEWGDKGVGLWAALETEMGRPSRNIRRRWKEIYEMGP